MNMSSNQLSFALRNNKTYEYDDYIVSDSNKDIHKFLLSWPNWGKQRLANILLIEGGAFSGKTHLAHIWRQFSSARFLTIEDFLSANLFNIIESKQCFIIDDIESFFAFEEILFHLYNMILDEKKFLLITSKKSPQKLDIKLKDLKSRILGCAHLKLIEPDHFLLEGILLKLLSDRQLRVNKEVIAFLINKIERTYEEINRFITLLDQKSLEQRRNITIPFLNGILKEE